MKRIGKNKADRRSFLSDCLLEERLFSYPENVGHYLKLLTFETRRNIPVTFNRKETKRN